MLSVREGDIGKLALLFEKHHRPLYGYFVKLTSDRPLSEDMVQEVFLRILKYRHTFRGTGEFAVWMYHIARNVLTDHARKWRREEPRDAGDLPDDQIPDDGAAAFDERVELLGEAMKQLATDKREVLLLSRYQNLKYAEIADLLGCSVEAVKVRVHRAMNDLRREFFKISVERNIQ
jgi:RNA polymerase sigma factor (sigma-70 family)